MVYFFLFLFFVIILLYSIFLIIINNKITILENKIINLFSKRTNNIPGLYEITKKYLVKHNEIFKNAIELKKEEFTKIDNNNSFWDLLQTEALIHKELNFIFKICKKNHFLEKNYKFLYIKEIIINKTFEIGDNVSLYKKIVKKYNNFIKIKNYTIIGLLIPIYKKEVL